MISDTEIEGSTEEGLPPSTNQESTPVECVFQNDLLLDKILDFAMMDDDKEEKRRTTNSCKLVQHLWLERVDAALRTSRKSKDHLVRLHSKRPDRVDKFIEAFGTCPCPLANRIPPFTMVYDGHPNLKFPETNYDNLLNCLTKCGSALVKLEILVVTQPIPFELKSLLYPLASAPLDLPKLESITVRILSRFDSSFDDVKARIKLFIQSILDGCECLQEFSFMCTRDEHFSCGIFENSNLPPSLTKANFHGILAPGLLAQLLVDNPLPNLIAVNLTVMTSECIPANELTHVLAHFRHQLLEFYVGVDTRYDFVSDPNKVIVLPVMERLQVFTCTTKSIAWSTSHSLSLDNHFPVLKRIQLKAITYDMWQKWVQNSTFSSVKEGRFSLELPDLGNANDHLLLLEQMEQIKQAFPNIVDLSLNIPFTKQTAHTKFIFEKMKQLQKLNICVTNCPVNMSSNEFDAWFLSLSPQEEFALVAQRDKWKKWTQGNMTNLRRLRISFTNGDIDNLRPSVLCWNFDEDEEEADDEESDKESSDEESSVISEEEWDNIWDYEDDDDQEEEGDW